MYYAAIGPVLCLFLVILYKILPNHIVKSSCRPDLFFHRDSYELCGPELGHLATAETYEGVPPLPCIVKLRRGPIAQAETNRTAGHRKPAAYGREKTTFQTRFLTSGLSLFFHERF